MNDDSLEKMRAIRRQLQSDMREIEDRIRKEERENYSKITPGQVLLVMFGPMVALTLFSHCFC